MRVDIHRETKIEQSSRARQLEAMFDVPVHDTSMMHWEGDVDLPHDWGIGLIVGPSGSGKSTLLTEMFGEHHEHEWGSASVIDGFSNHLSVEDISKVCQAVGFNTIPSWLRPYSVLSTGERFRVDLARSLIEPPDGGPVIVDEFTSVVDRQVAKIGAQAVAKYVRRRPGMQFVAASCHYDIVDWLQPDWVLEPATMTITRRSVQPRPRLAADVYRTEYSTWDIFAQFHYLTREMNRSAQCYVLTIERQPAAFAGVIHRPHPKTKNIKGITRIVTLPDWQGLGLAYTLADALGSAYKTKGYRLRLYPAHPSFIRSTDRSPNWGLVRAPKAEGASLARGTVGKQGGRPNAVFEYVGESMSEAQADRLIG